MARLPQSLDISAPRAERRSTTMAPATDYGLADAGAGLMQLAQVRQRDQNQRDDAAARDLLTRARADFEPKFAERAQAYDGRQSGFANQAVTDFDTHFAPFLQTGRAADRRPAMPEAKGLKAPGNLDAWDRPVLKNEDGSYSTTSSISIGTDKGEVVIPTVVDGKRLTNDQAIARYRKTGENFGAFETPADAEAFAAELHNRQDAYVQANGGPDGFHGQLPDGVRVALQRQLEAYKAEFGGRAIGVESEKRASIVAEQARVVEAQNVASGFTAFQTNYGEAYQAVYDAYDGSKNNLVGESDRLFEEARTAALEATPEEYRPSLDAKLQATKVQLHAQAMEAQDKGQTAFVASQAKDTSDKTINSVMANPAGFAVAITGATDLAAGLPASLKPKFLADYREGLASARVQGLMFRGDFRTAKAELQDGRYDTLLSPSRKAALMEGVRAQSARRASDLIEALRYGGDVDPDELVALAADSDDPGLKAHADYALAVGDAEAGAVGDAASGAVRGGRFAATNFVIDGLEGGEALVLDDNGKGPTRYGINQTANPDLDVLKLTRMQAVGRYRRYWNSVGGDRLPPALALVAFDAAVNQGEGAAREMLAESEGDVGRLLAIREARYRELAKSEGQRKNLGGWISRLGKVGAEAARIQGFANVQEGLSSDPVKFALGTAKRPALAAVPPLPADPSGAGFQAALKGRLQVGQMMAKTYRAPLRLLTNAEAAQYKDMIAQDPTEGVEFAGEALKALGPVGARSFLREIGLQGGGVEIHIADLAANGVTNFARSAAAGLALKKKGATLDGPVKGELGREVGSYADVFEGQPELKLNVQRTAEAVLLSDGAQDKDAVARAVSGALGGLIRDGRRYGGVIGVNGRKVSIPTWLAADYADDAMEALARGWEASKTGPVHNDGSPINAARISRMRLLQLASGNYLLLDEKGVQAKRRDGRIFEFDIDKARPGLRSLLGPKAVQ